MYLHYYHLLWRVYSVLSRQSGVRIYMLSLTQRRCMMSRFGRLRRCSTSPQWPWRWLINWLPMRHAKLVSWIRYSYCCWRKCVLDSPFVSLLMADGCFPSVFKRAVVHPLLEKADLGASQLWTVDLCLTCHSYPHYWNELFRLDEMPKASRGWSIRKRF